MKIILKRDWDIPISPPFSTEYPGLSHDRGKEINGHYGGRRDELNKLINELLRKPKGSILISGYRGVGKTSLVYKALSELKKKDNEIIIVMLNAAQLDAGLRNDQTNTNNFNQIDPKKIIENLIRRLYSTTKESKLDSEIKKEIDLLYKRAVAAEVNIIERYQDQEKFQQTNVREQKLNFIINKGYPILILTGVLSMALQYSNFVSVDWLNKLIPILVALFVPLTILYKTQNTLSEEKSLTKSADEIYMSDNCIGNLEFELEKIHKDLYYKHNIKVIYIIDELDKLEINNVSKQNRGQVDEILNYFKNFFTLSNAIFVFIGGEELYDRYLQASENIQKNIPYRSTNYTYFTSKYFISRPLWSDLNSYLNDIIEASDVEEEQLDILKRAMCFEAKNDFFDLKKFIDNRITNFDDSNRPIIELTDSNDDIVKSRFHKAITLIYDEKYMSKNPVKWRENEQLINKLYNYAYDIFNKKVTEEFEDPNGEATDSQMIRDFNGFLEHLGALQTRQERSENISGLTISIRKYVYSGDIPTEPPQHLSEATEFENRYIYNFELFLDYARAIVCAFKIAEGNEESTVPSFTENPSYLIKELSRIGYNIQKIYEHNCEIYEKILETKELYPNRREDIERKTRDIENHTQSMLNQLPIIISKMTVLLNPENNIQQRRIEKNSDIFNIIPNEYRSHFLDSQVIVNPDLSRQMLLVNKKMAFVRTIEAELIKYEATHKVVYISRIHGDNQAKHLYTISAVSPKELKESMIPLLVYTKKFFKAQEE